MRINNNKIIPQNINQVPDSVSSSSFNSKPEVQDTGSTFVFGTQNKSLMTVESADTVKEVIEVPATIRVKNYIVKQKEYVDTLKYFTEYIHQLTILDFDNNSLHFLDKLYCTKPDISVKYKNIISKRADLIKHLKQKKEVLSIKKVVESKPKESIKNTVVTVSSKTVENSLVNYKPNSWVVGVVVFSVFIFAWVRLFYYKNYKIILKSGYNYNYSIKLFKEVNSGSQRISFFLNFIFISNLSLFLYLIIGYLKINVPFESFILLGFLFLIITFTYIIKYLIIKITGFVFSSDVIASEYVSNIWLYNKLLGISLFPVVISLPYIDLAWKIPIIYFGVFLVAIFFIFRLIRSFQIVFRIKFSIIYWFLYLCTLEILPVFVLSKIIGL